MVQKIYSSPTQLLAIVHDSALLYVCTSTHLKSGQEEHRIEIRVVHVMMQLIFHQYFLARRLASARSEVDRSKALVVSHIGFDPILQQEQKARGAAIVRCRVHWRVTALVCLPEILVCILEQFAQKFRLLQPIGAAGDK